MDIINGVKQSPRVYPFDNIGPYESTAKHFVPGWKFFQISIFNADFDDLRFGFYPCFMHQRTYIENVKFTVIASRLDSNAKIRPTLYRNVNGVPYSLYADFGAIDASSNGVKSKAYQNYIDTGPYFIGFLNNTDAIGTNSQHAGITTSSGILVNEPYSSDHNFYSSGQIQQDTDGGNIYSFHKQIFHTAYENIEGWANNGAPSIIDPSDLYIGLTDSQAGFPILWFEQGNP